jgi:uncharacterized protein involved in outer membrane biogenesis
LGVRAGGLVLAGVVIIAILFQWNWLRGPLAWELEQKLHRPVSISGDLEVHPWSGTPWLRINGMTVGDRRSQSGQLFATLPRLTVGWRWLSLFAPRLEFPLVWADRPSVAFGDVTPNGAQSKFSMAGMPRIDHLVITRGAIALVDSQYRLAFSGGILTNERRVPSAGPNDSAITGSIVIGSPRWAGTRQLLNAPNLLVRVKLLPLTAGKLGISLIKVDQPAINAVRDASGRANWQFSNKADEAAPHVPPIGRLVITGGAVRYQDARLQLNFLGSVSTNETVADVGRGSFLLQGRGMLRQTPFTARVSGGPLVNIDPHQPYPFNALVQTQGTKVNVVGSMARPFDLQNVSGRLRASGPDLADLYHLTGVALPNTPPYDLSTHFARVGSHYALRQMAGRVGESDLEGDVSVDDTSGRPFLEGDLSSRRLNLTDLTAVAGGVPKHAAGHALSPIQRTTAAELAAEHRILPNTHLDVSRIRGTDANVTYRARSVQAGHFPIRSLLLKVTLDHGQLNIDPLMMTLPQGNLAAVLHLDARGPVPAERMDLRLTNARLENLMGLAGSNPALEGGLYARARLSGRGDSVRAVAASVDGDIRAVIPHGAIRQTFAELMGIDATKALLLLITNDKGQTPIRCGVADFRAQSGVLTAQRFVFDTGVVMVSGKGDIDLRDEALNLQLSGKPKKFRLVRIGAPITVKGSLAAPKFGVDVGKAAGQLVVSGLLGAVVAPLSALLPFVNPGLAKNADCAALVRDMDIDDAPTPPPPSAAK